MKSVGNEEIERVIDDLETKAKDASIEVAAALLYAAAELRQVLA